MFQKTTKYIFLDQLGKSENTGKVVLSRFDSETSLIIKINVSPVNVDEILLQQHKNNET